MTLTARLTTEQQGLAANPLALRDAFVRAGRAAKNRPDLAADCYSAALLALVDAAGQFDSARGVKFTTFAQRKVRWAILDLLREGDGGRGGQSLPTVAVGAVMLKSVIDRRSLPQHRQQQRTARQQEMLQCLYSVLMRLPPQVRAIWQAHYFWGIPQPALSEWLEVSRFKLWELLTEIREWVWAECRKEIH